MKTFSKKLGALTLVVAMAGALSLGCDDSSNNNSDGGGTGDMAMQQYPDLLMAPMPDMLPACVMNPMTHVEIINACTNADFVDKMPFYPMNAPGGVLPPLP